MSGELASGFRPGGSLSVDPTPMGVDLADPVVFDLFSRLFWGRIASQAEAGGLDTEDLFQKLALRVLRANAGGRPYDPRKSSLSNYLYISMTSGLRNAVDQQKRAERRGWVCGDERDAALEARAVAPDVDPMEDAWSPVIPRRKARRTPYSRRSVDQLPRMR